MNTLCLCLTDWEKIASRKHPKIVSFFLPQFHSIIIINWKAPLLPWTKHVTMVLLDTKKISHFLKVLAIYWIAVNWLKLIIYLLTIGNWKCIAICNFIVIDVDAVVGAVTCLSSNNWTHFFFFSILLVHFKIQCTTYNVQCRPNSRFNLN